MTKHYRRNRLQIADPSDIPSGSLAGELSRIYGIISAEFWNHSDEAMIIELFSVYEMLQRYAERLQGDQMSGIYIDDIKKRINKILWWNEVPTASARATIRGDRILAAKRFIASIVDEPVKAQRRALTHAGDTVISYIAADACTPELRELVLMERESRKGTYRLMKTMTDRDLNEFSQKVSELSENMMGCINEELKNREVVRLDRSNYSTRKSVPRSYTEAGDWWREQE